MIAKRGNIMFQRIRETMEVFWQMFRKKTEEVKQSIDASVLAGYMDRNMELTRLLADEGKPLAMCYKGATLCCYLTKDDREGVRGYCTKYCVHFAITPFQVKGDCAKAFFDV